MKKIILLLILLIIPINVLAYSNKVIPGGETLGIEVNAKGVMIIGFYQINGNYNKANPQLKSGDYIIKVNNEEVNNIKDLTNIIEKNTANGDVKLTILRNNKEKESILKLIEDNGVYKTGLYVKDTITGIGTLTYIDPETKIYGALGHEIIEANSNSKVEIKSGSIFKNSITSIDKSANGIPGSKNAKFYYDTVYGTIIKNTELGIYGVYEYKLPNKDLVEVSNSSDIKIGKANIYTVLKDLTVEKFDIEITSINEDSDVKNITFDLADSKLIDTTGGIVQGMSGSPILQNNKIIGAVTHVIVDNPLKGYGIFITSMLNEGER